MHLKRTYSEKLLNLRISKSGEISKIKRPKKVIKKIIKKKKKPEMGIWRWFTLFRSMKINIELLHAIVDHLHLVIAHHPNLHKKKNIKKNNKKVSKKKNLSSWEILFGEYYSFIKSISRRLLGEDISPVLFFFFSGDWVLWVIRWEREREG